jgi:hypothetical protein
MTRWAQVVEQARAIVAEYGGRVAPRHVYYRLVVAKAIRHTTAAYRRLPAYLGVLRGL